ncbi:MAG: hypothetical protein ACI311_03940 [Bacilli bacterium]
MADEEKNKQVESPVDLSNLGPSPFDDVHKRYIEAVNEVVDSDPTSREFLVAIRNSPDQEISQLSRTETKKYDLLWIQHFENAIPALENISKDPKKHIRLERYITPIELARKITNESVIHLASHTQYIKDIDKDGNIIPNKILTVTAEDEYGIYENRFIKTCIERALNFINKRYDYITKHADTRDSDAVVVKNKVQVGEVLYEYETKVKISVPSADEGNREANELLLKKIALLRRRLAYLSQSWFMEQLKDCKPVNSPIMLTNIIVKNPNYKKAHILWKFMESYDKLGISIHVKETSAKFDEPYVDELQKNMFGGIISLQTNKTRMIDLAKVKAYRIQPKIGNRVIDKDFLDSKFDIEGRYVGGTGSSEISRNLTPKMRNLRKKQEQARLAKLKVLEQKRLEREKQRALAKQKEEERIAKMRAEQKAAEERARIAFEKAEAKRLEEERIAREKAREKAILDAERDALNRARENAKRQAEQDRLAELKVLRPSGLTEEEEEEKRLLEEAEEMFKIEEESRRARMEEIKAKEEARKKAIEDKIAAREQAKLEREQRQREMLLEEERRRQQSLRNELIAKAQAKLEALRMAQEAYRRNAGLDEFDEEDDDFTYAEDIDNNIDNQEESSETLETSTSLEEDNESTLLEQEEINEENNEDDNSNEEEIEDNSDYIENEEEAKKIVDQQFEEEEDEESFDDDDFDFEYSDDNNNNA